MEIIVLKYKNFKKKLSITKQYKGYRAEDLGDGILMLSKKIILN